MIVGPITRNESDLLREHRLVKPVQGIDALTLR